MPAPELDLHGHHWVNTIGHSAGVIVFANLGWLLYRDARRMGQAVRVLPIACTLMALVWDLFLLLALGFRERDAFLANAFAAVAFAALSVLPALLLDVGLQRELKGLRWAAYGVSALCAGMHLSEIVAETPGVHGLALVTLSGGFAGLAALSLVLRRRTPQVPTAASLCLFLLALSFLHFDAGASEGSLWTEILLHHAGIPLALFVVLQDYRFLLLDAFMRLAANGALAAVFVTLYWQGRGWMRRLEDAAQDPFWLGLAFVMLASAFLAFALLRERVQDWLTRQIFLRRDPKETLAALRQLGGGEESILEAASRLLAEYFRCDRRAVAEEAQPGYDATVTLRFLKGDVRYLQMGGRRFLSEDIEMLESFAAQIAREVDRARTQELERLMIEAELRALQSQIHPHFLFNALNALYGSIPRTAPDARRLVLSLSEVFRYFLTTSKAMVKLEEELRIVEAYLEIEKARLGTRLETRVRAEAEALGVAIPVLSIQPLVENAIKHGVSAVPGRGEVELEAICEDGKLFVRVQDTGEGFEDGMRRPAAADSNRVGLENVRRRLELHYGKSASLRLERNERGTLAVVEIPIHRVEEPAGGKMVAAHGNS